MPANRKPKSDALSAYRAKRKLDATPEPGGRVTPAPAAGGLFVVHKHAATRLHYDLRLEMDGVLRSWAVPKGPSKNPADKRLAVHVEDHPLEYGDFEGIIPEGNYGAGAVIVWDRGRWLPLEDIAEGFKKGKLLFELQGYKLRGAWTLVKLKKGQKEWLLIKERDGYVAAEGDAFPQGSVLSGFTVEELRDGKDRGGPVKKELAKAGAPKRVVTAEEAEPMLAEVREEPFTKPGWLFEPKLDGYRVRAACGGGNARLVSRNGHDITAGFPEIARALSALPYNEALLDGELVVLDEAGRPNFGKLQDRALLRRGPDVRRAAVELPATLYVFDLLAFEGYDARPLPLERRKALLQKLLPAAGPVRSLDHFEKEGEELYEKVVLLGLEGIVAKKADAPYRAGRSRSWLKIRAVKTDDFVVVGYSPPKGSRSGFGALHLAAYDDGKLTYIGRVGSGFDSQQLDQISAELEASKRAKPACIGPIPKDPGHVWVEPKLVAEVRYKEITDDGLLRQPTFVRFRDDKRPEECVRRETRNVKRETNSEAQPLIHDSRFTLHEVQFTNLEKVFWPDEGYTKGNLIEYYRAISPWLLAYLADRPVVMTRFPDGINGKSFFQKDAPQYAHDYVRTVTVWSEDSQRELNYFVIENEASLLYVANMASIPLHIWGSRVATLQNPDWCILDLDPKGAPFKDVVAVAREVKALCDEIEMPCFIKTSGSTGLHVLLPMGRLCTYEQCRTLGGLLARVVADRVPEIATITRQVGKREGRVYLDYVQNGHGRLLVAPFSARPLPGAPVSMPLKWSEVNEKLDLKKFTIKTAPARMKKLGEDPVRPVIDLAPDLPTMLERLQGATE